MKKHILTAFLMAATLTGCGANLIRTIDDTEFGTWKYYEDGVDSYTDINLVYVARNGQTLENFFATTGFYHGVAIATKCSTIKNDKTCAAWQYYLISPNAEIIADLSAYELPTLGVCLPHPKNSGDKPYPSLLYLADRGEPQPFDFPLASNFLNLHYSSKPKHETCAQSTLSDNHLAFYKDRILVYDRKADRYGFIDFNGKLVIPAIYKAASSFYPDGYAYVINEDNVPGKVTADGTFIPFTYPCITNVSDDLRVVSNEGRIYQYSTNTPFNHKLAYYTHELTSSSKQNCSGSKVGVADKDYHIIVPVQYDQVTVSKDTPFIIASNNNAKAPDLYRKDGTALFKGTDYVSIIPGKEFVTRKHQNGKWSVSNEMGTFDTTPIYDTIRYFYQTKDIGTYMISNYIIVRQGNKAGIIDNAVRLVVPIKFDDISFESEDLLITELNNKYGVFYKGVELYEPIYTQIGEFIDGKAIAKIGEKEHYLFLDKEKEIEFYKSMHVPPPRFDHKGPKPEK